MERLGSDQDGVGHSQGFLAQVVTHIFQRRSSHQHKRERRPKRGREKVRQDEINTFLAETVVRAPPAAGAVTLTAAKFRGAW